MILKLEHYRQLPPEIPLPDSSPRRNFNCSPLSGPAISIPELRNQKEAFPGDSGEFPERNTRNMNCLHSELKLYVLAFCFLDEVVAATPSKYVLILIFEGIGRKTRISKFTHMNVKLRAQLPRNGTQGFSGLRVCNDL